VYFTCGSLLIWTVFRFDILAHINFLFSLKLSLRDAPLSRFRCRDPNQCLPNILKMLPLALPQIYTRVLLLEVYRFRQCLGWRFSHISTFFSLASCRAFRDAPQSRFRCGDPNQHLPNFIKMLLLALRSNLHTCISLVVVYLFGQCLGEKFPAISTLFPLVSSRAFKNAPHSQLRCRDLKACLLDFLKMLDLALSQIYTRVFHLWKSIDFDSV